MRCNLRAVSLLLFNTGAFNSIQSSSERSAEASSEEPVVNQNKDCCEEMPAVSECCQREHFDEGLPASLRTKTQQQPILTTTLHNPSTECHRCKKGSLSTSPPPFALCKLKKRRSISQLLSQAEVTEEHKTLRKIKSIDTEDEEERVVKKDKKMNLQLQMIGDYRVCNMLGQGGGAKVFLGRHTRTGEKVAIKLLEKMKTNETLEDIGPKQKTLQLQRLRKEYITQFELTHKHILKILGVVETASMVCMVLEYAENGDLFDYLYKREKLSHAEAWRIFKQLVSALGHLHSRGYCHRDLKPENVFLDKHNNVLLGDFGHAEVWPFALEKQPPGSLNYAAPEVLTASSRAYVGPEIDIWSLGVILLTMVTGKNPFSGRTSAEVVKNICRVEEFLNHSALRPDPHLRDLIRSLLSIDPWRRARLFDVQNHPWFLYGPQARKLFPVSAAASPPNKISSKPLNIPLPPRAETRVPSYAERATPS